MALANFRADINGLRAYAVIAVLLYHFGTPAFEGGFVGVDVFFVISGFLMTAIIMPAAQSGTLSLSSFYFSRARRIIPALAAVCLATLAFGWFWLPPYLYEELGKNAGSSLLFISNFTYNRAGGYFATPAHDNWLLHTWSLSVEWQFYVLYPIILLATLKLANKRKLVVTGILLSLFAASLVYCVYLSQQKPSSAFFMLPSRSWELLAGGLIYIITANRKAYNSRTAEAIGFTLILFSTIALDQSIAWPGMYAIIPVSGACLVILANRQESILTNNLITQAIGKWSYSIYLWHWPLLVGLRYLEKSENVYWLTSAGAVAIFLGALSYTYIEKTASRLTISRHDRRGWTYISAMATGSFAAALVVYTDDGVPRTLRLSNEVLVAAFEKTNVGRLTKCNTKESNCILGTGDLRAIVWGDSHAVFTVPAIAQVADRMDGSILFFGQQSCPVIFNIYSPDRNNADFCKTFNDMVFERIQKLDSQIPVIIINRAAAYIQPGDRFMHFGAPIAFSPTERQIIYLNHMRESLCKIAKTHPVYLMMPIPEMQQDVPGSLVKALLFGRGKTDVSSPLTEYETKNKFMIEAMSDVHKQCGVNLLDPTDYLCNSSKCFGSIDGRPLYADNNHLSIYGSQFLAPLFKDILKSQHHD